jgi:hypothetical protein
VELRKWKITRISRDLCATLKSGYKEVTGGTIRERDEDRLFLIIVFHCPLVILLIDSIIIVSIASIAMRRMKK